MIRVWLPKMHIIKQIFSDNLEDWVHQRFIRYSRGEFGGPLLGVKITSNALKVNASADYATVLGNAIAKGADHVELKGTIIAKREIEPLVREVLNITKSAARKGLYTLEVLGSLSGSELCELYEKIPDANFLLDITSDKQKLKCKKKLPKPGGKVKDNFCSAKIDSKMLDMVKDEILFDVGSFKEVSVSHKYVISEIVAPEGITDPAQIRVLAKRKGKVLRKVVADGSEATSEHDFSV